jgi:Tfp pilus assembly protein FimT
MLGLGMRTLPLCALRRRRAITLVEMLAVASLLAIISVVVVPMSLSGAEVAADAAKRIRGDLSYAQSRAILLRSSQCFVVDTAQGFYYLSTAQAPGTAITDPVSHNPYRVFLRQACENQTLSTTENVEAFPAVMLSSASFNSGAVLTFNALGVPMVGSAPLTAGTIGIAAGSRQLSIVVDATTGLTSVEESTAVQEQ